MAPDPVEIAATAIARKWADAPDTVDRSCARAALDALRAAGWVLLSPEDAEYIRHHWGPLPSDPGEPVEATPDA